MRYTLYADPRWVKESYGLNPGLQSPIKWNDLPPVMHSGLTNWGRVFKGHYHMPMTVDEYGNYDVIHVNMTPKNVGMIGRIRRHLAEVEREKWPKIVANTDHAIDMWVGYERIDLLREDLLKADALFSVEPVMAGSLALLTDREVTVCPHPTNVDQLREKYGKMKNTDPFNKRTILVVSHPYDQNYIVPTLVVQELKKDMPDLAAILIGQVQKDGAWLRSVYDEWYESVQFPVMMEVVSRANVVVDTAITHSYGRLPVECAAVGTPCVADRNVASARDLFTGLCVDVHDGSDITGSVRMALSDPKGFMPDDSTVDYYGYAKRREQFEVMINGK